MKSLPTTGGFKTAIAVSVVAVLASGCSCMKGREAKAQYPPAPIVTTEGQPYPAQGTAMGAPGPAYQTGAGTSGNETVIPLHQEKLEVGTAQINEGGVRIRKEVKTETVNQPVQVRHETVTVERVPGGAAPAGGPQAGQGDLNTPFKPGEVTVNLNQEKPIAQTETVPAGSVVVRKNVTSQPVTIQRQVRREVVQATPLGNSKDVNISGNLNAPGNEAAGAAPPYAGQAGGAGGGGAGITQWQQLEAAPDPMALSGQPVDLSNVKVQRVLGDHLLAIGPENSRPMYVDFNGPLSGISTGQTVNIKGTVQPVPSDTSSLGLTEGNKNLLEGQKTLIMATDITPSNQSPSNQ